MRTPLQQSTIRITMLLACFVVACFGLYETTKVSAADKKPVESSEKKADKDEDKGDKKPCEGPGEPPGTCELKPGVTFPTPFPPNPALTCTGGNLCNNTNFVCNTLLNKKCKHYIAISSDSKGTCSCGCG